MQEEARGGSRGGYDQFSWETVKEDRNRICYLGNSIKAPVGRWQVGKDVGWFQKPKEDRTDMPIKASLSSSASSIKEERELLREKEKEMMANALLYGFGNPLSSTSILSQSLISSTFGLFENQGKDIKEEENSSHRHSGFERSISPEMRKSTNESRKVHNSSRVRETSSSFRDRNSSRREDDYDRNYSKRDQDYIKSSRRWSKNDYDRHLNRRNAVSDKYSSKEKDGDSLSRHGGNSPSITRSSRGSRFRDRTAEDDLHCHSAYERKYARK